MWFPPCSLPSLALGKTSRHVVRTLEQHYERPKALCQQPCEGDTSEADPPVSVGPSDDCYCSAGQRLDCNISETLSWNHPPKL